MISLASGARTMFCDVLTAYHENHLFEVKPVNLPLPSGGVPFTSPRCSYRIKPSSKNVVVRTRCKPDGVARRDGTRHFPFPPFPSARAFYANCQGGGGFCWVVTSYQLPFPVLLRPVIQNLRHPQSEHRRPALVASAADDLVRAKVRDDPAFHLPRENAGRHRSARTVSCCTLHRESATMYSQTIPGSKRGFHIYLATTCTIKLRPASQKAHVDGTGT